MFASFFFFFFFFCRLVLSGRRILAQWLAIHNTMLTVCAEWHKYVTTSTHWVLYEFEITSFSCASRDVSPQLRRWGFLISWAVFLVCSLSVPINLLCIYSVFLRTERRNMKHNRHTKSSMWNPADNSPWSWTTNDLKLLQIWVWSSDDSSEGVKRKTSE